MVRGMAGSSAGRLVATLAVVMLGPGVGADRRLEAQQTAPGGQATVPGWQQQYQMAALQKVPSELSVDCRVKEPAFVGHAPLKKLRRALIEKRPVKVLAIGSSSTVGIGASSPLMAYPVRLESDLEGFIKGVDVQMITRGVGGEVAVAAAERLKLEVADNRPDLVVWQVGTNDAIARIDEDDFGELLKTTLQWLKKAKVDVVLIDPQFTDKLASDEHYRSIVKTIDEVAREEKVMLVHRFEAMEELIRIKGGDQSLIGRDGLHLNDLGYRCMAEYAARAIVSGVLSAELEVPAGEPPPQLAPPKAN